MAALMYPRALDPAFDNPAEAAVFENLKRYLSSDYVVIHSLRWTPAPQSRRGKIEPEIDFLIMRPDRIILCMEVKGGRIEVKNKEWYQNGKRIEDPLQQAVGNKHSLLDFVRSQPGHEHDWLPIDCCLAFPDINANPAPHIADALVLDRYGLGAIEDWVESAMKYAMDRQRADQKLSQEMIGQILGLFVEGRTAKLFQIFQQQEREFARLTEKQFKVLDLIRNQRRAVVAGCAGSGKTFLAMEKARRLASKGLSVLFTCYGAELAEFVRGQLADFPSVTAMSFFDLYHWLHERSGTPAGRRGRHLGPDPNGFTLAADLEESISRLIEIGADPRFDAIIVDEGQMFSEYWWVVMDKLLIDGDQGIRYIFYDDNQRVYGERDEIPDEEHSLVLDENCRNTQHIHWATIQFYQSEEIPSCNRVEGLPIEVYEYEDDEDMVRRLSRILHGIIIDGKVSAKDVIVLTPDENRRLTKLGIKQVGAFKLSLSETSDPNCVRSAVVADYRGLERKVVILAGMDRRSSKHAEVLYIGMSRARDHLVILFSADLNASVKKQILACSQAPDK